MPFDADLILKGLYSGALVEVDESDAVAVALAANSDGNCVVDVRKSGKKGLAAAVIFTALSATAPYTDEGTIVIEESDELDRNWESLVTFPRIHPYRIRLKDCVATTGFVALDATTPRVLTATTDTATGLIISFDEALKVIGGVGDIVVEMQDSADVYGTPGDTLTATSGTGVATQGAKAGVMEPNQQVPGVMIRRFCTDKRYLRCQCTDVEDGLGTAWILISGHPLDRL